MCLYKREMERERGMFLLWQHCYATPLKKGKIHDVYKFWPLEKSYFMYHAKKKIKKNLDLYYFNGNIPAEFKGVDSRSEQENLLQVLWIDEKKNRLKKNTLICIGKIIVFRELL